jgi:hypothetical protein
MILILSDMFKTLWFAIYAVAALTPESVDSTSAFCQISGFFTTVGIELSGMKDSSWLVFSNANCNRLFIADDYYTQHFIHIQPASLD